MIPDFRFYITNSEETKKEVFPLNFNSTSLVDEVESGQIFRRQPFNGILIFGTNSWGENITGGLLNRKVDFDMFLDIEFDPLRLCEKQTLEIERDGAEYWVGTFSTSDGKWDMDNCTFEVTPTLKDKYSPFDENGDTQYNILEVGLPVMTTRMTRAVPSVGPWTFIYDRNRFLTDVITYLAQQVSQDFDPSFTLVSSFFNDAINPITLTTNHYRYITIAQKSDIKRYLASERAWKGFMSFNECMELLKIWNLYWDYDEVTHEFTVEHIYTFNSMLAAGIDLRTEDLCISTNKYSYSKSDMPRIEKWSFMEGYFADFIPHSISYASPCVNQDKNSNTIDNAFNVTTDIEYIQDCMDNVDLRGNISDEGWIILANYLESGLYYVYLNRLGLGYEAHFNGDMGWGLLHNCFFKHDRVLMSGTMNGAGTNFYSAKRTKIQDCAIINCWVNGSHITAFDAQQLLTTELGEEYLSGAKAFVNRADISPSGLIKLKLGYAPAEVAIIPVSYANVIQILEIANQIHPIVPTNCTYYATASTDADANLTITFTVRILTDWGILNNVTDSITILAGARTGNVTIAWPVPAGSPAEANECRFEIVNVTVVGGALTWETSFILDTNANCI